MIIRSIEKPIFKEKIRIRAYGDIRKNSTLFLEIKKKYKKVGYKRRSPLSLENVRDLLVNKQIASNDIICDEILYVIKRYSAYPKALICCERAAFSEPFDSSLRITIDSNITGSYNTDDFFESPSGVPLIEENNYLLEIKTESALPLWLTDIINRLNIFPVSFSKYGKLYIINKGNHIYV